MAPSWFSDFDTGVSQVHSQAPTCMRCATVCRTASSPTLIPKRPGSPATSLLLLGWLGAYSRSYDLHRLAEQQSKRHTNDVMEQDPFDSLLGLEDRYYDEGYQLGVADGSRAGRIEGRIFGMEKGFDKFVASGVLHGRAEIWGSRLPRGQELGSDSQPLARSVPNEGTDERIEASQGTTKQQDVGSMLPSLAANPRLEKHIQTLYALVEPVSLSTQNTEDAVSDFDDRLKRASAKAKVIEKLVGETSFDTEEDFTTKPGSSAGRDRQVKLAGNEKTDSSMEDLGSSRSRLPAHRMDI